MFMFWKIVGDAFALGVMVLALLVTHGVYRH